MGFFDTFQDIGGGAWISGAEKDTIIEQGIPFVITGVVDDDANKYGSRFVLNVNLPNPETGDVEERKIGFKKETVESRDRMLLAMQKALAEGELIEPTKLTKIGNAVLIKKA